MAKARRHARKRVVLIGTEGASERAFVGFLQRCCNKAAVPTHLRAWLGKGGDSMAVVEGMQRYLHRNSFASEIRTKIVLLDEDRIADDRRSGRDAVALARRAGIEVILQRPSLEGVLVRLHPSQEARRLAGDAERELRRLWPDYTKPPTAAALFERFGLEDLMRAASRDPDLAALLGRIGLDQ